MEIKKPKKSDFKFHFGMCWSFRKDLYDEAMLKYKEFIKSAKQIKQKENKKI